MKIAKIEKINSVFDSGINNLKNVDGKYYYYYNFIFSKFLILNYKIVTIVLIVQYTAYLKY